MHFRSGQRETNFNEDKQIRIDRKLLGAAIRDLRQARGLTQVELARQAGLSKSGNSIALIERGERGLSVEVMNRVSEALEIPAGCLAVMGSETESDSAPLKRLLNQLQRTVLTTVRAQESLRRSNADKKHRELARNA